MSTSIPYQLKTRYFVVHDKPRSASEIQQTLFKDAHALFKMRIQKLGNLEQITTDEESEIMRIMLNGLIAAKKELQNNN